MIVGCDASCISLVSSIRPLLFRLEDEAGFRLSPVVKTAALNAVQENLD